MTETTAGTPIALTAVEQALVTEVATWTERAMAEVRMVADAKLAVVLDAHGVRGQACEFQKTDDGWVLVPPAPAADA